MKIKAMVSFSGILSMGAGEIREYDNEAVLADLLQAGYVVEAPEPAEDEKPAKKRTTKKAG